MGASETKKLCFFRPLILDFLGEIWGAGGGAAKSGSLYLIHSVPVFICQQFSVRCSPRLVTVLYVVGLKSLIYFLGGNDIQKIDDKNNNRNPTNLSLVVRHQYYGTYLLLQKNLVGRIQSSALSRGKSSIFKPWATSLLTSNKNRGVCTIWYNMVLVMWSDFHSLLLLWRQGNITEVKIVRYVRVRTQATARRGRLCWLWYVP